VQGQLDVRRRVEERLHESAAATAAGLRPTFRVVLAELDGAPIGFAAFSVVEASLLAAGSAVVVDVVHVGEGHRKSGVGRALLRHAVVLADEVGATDVVAHVPPGRRDIHRFLARYGFTPQVVRRTAPLGALRRRLGVEARIEARDAATERTEVQRSLRRRVVLAARRPARLAR
jgi:GNAT superfamily N-acetyltransferase